MSTQTHRSAAEHAAFSGLTLLASLSPPKLPKLISHQYPKRLTPPPPLPSLQSNIIICVSVDWSLNAPLCPLFLHPCPEEPLKEFLSHPGGALSCLRSHHHVLWTGTATLRLQRLFSKVTQRASFKATSKWVCTGKRVTLK